MKDYAELIRAVAALLWPALAITTLLVFRTQIQDLLSRLRRGKMFGQEIELDKSLRKLDETAQAAVSEIPQATQQPSPTLNHSTSHPKTQDIVDHVLAQAAQSPKVALILLSSELEREVRQLLAAMGLAAQARSPSFVESIRVLEQHGALPRHLVGSVQQFWTIRNTLVHGHVTTDNDIIRAIDSGLTILRILQAIPHEINVVYHAGVDVFSDADATNIRDGIKGVVLETTSPGRAAKALRIFPTTRSHFHKGKRVVWEWNLDLIVGESWYRHPDTGVITYGWTSSAEFVGRHIEDV